MRAGQTHDCAAMAQAEYNEFLSLIKNGSFAEAVALAERQSILAEEKNEFWLTQLSLAYTRAGRYREALDSADKALVLTPTNRYAILARADALAASSDYVGALASYEEALDNERTLPRARRGVLTCMIHLKQWARMLDLANQWDLDPAAANSFRIKALIGLERTEEDMALCRTWLATSPDHPQALWELTNLEVKKEGLETVRARMARLARIPGKPLSVQRRVLAAVKRALDGAR